MMFYFRSTGRLVAPVLFLILSACASRQEVASDYRNLFSEHGPSHTKRTVIFFLVDGMPVATVQSEMNSGRLPYMKDFFIGDKNQFAVARTAFPSLTYPSISSLLTERHVDQHGILGNLNEQEGRLVSFENISSYKQLNATIKGKTIFARLKAKGLRSVSLDFAFHADADASTDTKDLESGLSILSRDYTYVDIKTIDSLKAILEETHTAQWPDFIFVHLIGLDLTSHDHGPESREALDYLESLDASLSHVFKILNRVEKAKARKIVVMMSADHGFDKKVERFVDLAPALKNIDQGIKFLNEGRYGSTYLPRGWSAEKRTAFVQSLEAMPQMDIVAQRNGDQIFVEGQSSRATISYKPSAGGECGESSFLISVRSEARVPRGNFGGPRDRLGQLHELTNGVNAGTRPINASGPSSEAPPQVALLSSAISEPVPPFITGPTPFRCPENLDLATNNLFYPYFAANISHYFYGHNHPDVVIIPKPGVAFTKEYKGQHGGPTPRELFVPLLIHNGSVNPAAGVPSLSELLRFL